MCRRDRLLAPRAEAEECFRRAIEVASGQQATSLALRAAISLNRLLGSGERRTEGQAVLRDLRGRFTEGFDAPDLLEAAALLDGDRPQFS